MGYMFLGLPPACWCAWYCCIRDSRVRRIRSWSMAVCSGVRLGGRPIRGEGVGCGFGVEVNCGEGPGGGWCGGWGDMVGEG
jgi:hypothetical protein